MTCTLLIEEFISLHLISLFFTKQEMFIIYRVECYKTIMVKKNYIYKLVGKSGNQLYFNVIAYSLFKNELII